MSATRISCNLGGYTLEATLRVRTRFIPLLLLIQISCIGPFLVPGIDGAIGIEANDPFYLGHQGVPVQVKVTNLGDTAAPAPINVVMQASAGVTFAGHGPAGWTCTGSSTQFICEWNDPLPAGGSLPDLELDVAVGTFEETKGELRLCATLRVENDVNPNNNNTCQTFQAVAPTADYDLAITKTLHRTLGPYGLVAYIIEVENLGPDDVNDPILIEDFLPPGLTTSGFTTTPWCPNWQNLGTGYTCTLTHLAAGDTFFLLLSATAAPNLEGVIENCATVSAPQDLNPSNDEACFTFEVGAPEPFDIEVTGEVTKVPEPGKLGTYHYYLHNNGPNPTTETLYLLIDAPPPQSDLTYIAGITGSQLNTTNTGLCDPVGTTQLSCPVEAVLQPGDTRAIRMNFRMHAAATGNAAACLSINPPGDTDATNDEHCLSTQMPPPIAGGFGVTTMIQQRGEARVGALGALSLSVESTGSEAVPEGVTVFVILPPDVSFVGAAGSRAFSCTPEVEVEGARVVQCFYDGPMDSGIAEDLELAVWYEEAGDVTVCSDASPEPDGATDVRSCATITVDP